MHSGFMRYLRGLLLIAALVGVAACTTGPKVRTDYDKTVDFTQYTTFGFANPLGTDREGYQTIISTRLKTATRHELEARGLRYTETAPQLLVNFSAKLSEKLRTESVPGPTMNMAVGRGYYGYRTGFYTAWPLYDTETRVSQYTEGTLNVDVVDAVRKQLVWEGVAVGSVSEKAQANLQAVIDVTVTAIFKKYPVALPATTTTK